MPAGVVLLVQDLQYESITINAAGIFEQGWFCSYRASNSREEAHHSGNAKMAQSVSVVDLMRQIRPDTNAAYLLDTLTADVTDQTPCCTPALYFDS